MAMEILDMAVDKVIEEAWERAQEEEEQGWLFLRATIVVVCKLTLMVVLGRIKKKVEGRRTANRWSKRMVSRRSW
ncbi:hypothetical protein E2562_031558 [Oryza meyeriana var. granulata]|uniref:Uncharacterized protein n=1 Tax=Oryza meyeriana var. granulata TaxID=110450 RepID=A0A6G1CWY9_9ORYZ|nr:hypothetical protein E2562_031558 [Oryza meyeriana var. granulata]